MKRAFTCIYKILNSIFLQTFLIALAAILAWRVGQAQVGIISRQTAIQERADAIDSQVAVFATPANGAIYLHNVGRVNLYLHAYGMANAATTNTEMKYYDGGHLMPASSGVDKINWLPFPNGLHDGDKFRMILYMKDDFKRKWISEFGGEVYSESTIGTKKDVKLMYNIWSYKTFTSEWIDNMPSTTILHITE